MTIQDYTRSPVQVTGPSGGQNRDDGMGELGMDEGPDAMLWTKTSSLVIKTVYIMLGLRTGRSNVCHDSVLIISN